MYGSGAGQADRSLCEAAREGRTLKHGEVREVVGDGSLGLPNFYLVGFISGESDV